jgi:hypothetical protein
MTERIKNLLNKNERYKSKSTINHSLVNIAREKQLHLSFPKIDRKKNVYK